MYEVRFGRVVECILDVRLGTLVDRYIRDLGL